MTINRSMYMVMRAITNLLPRHLSFAIPVVLLILSILLNIVTNLHLKVSKLYFEVNINMIRYAFKIESLLHQFINVVLLSFQCK